MPTCHWPFSGHLIFARPFSKWPSKKYFGLPLCLFNIVLIIMWYSNELCLLSTHKWQLGQPVLQYFYCYFVLWLNIVCNKVLYRHLAICWVMSWIFQDGANLEILKHWYYYFHRQTDRFCVSVMWGLLRLASCHNNTVYLLSFHQYLYSSSWKSRIPYSFLIYNRSMQLLLLLPIKQQCCHQEQLQ